MAFYPPQRPPMGGPARMPPITGGDAADALATRQPPVLGGGPAMQPPGAAVLPGQPNHSGTALDPAYAMALKRKQAAAARPTGYQGFHPPAQPGLVPTPPQVPRPITPKPLTGGY